MSKERVINQVKAIINEHYVFMGYTQFANYISDSIEPRGIGYSKDEKARIKIKKIRAMFNNRLIIIDEVHNLTRLMAGKLDKYLILSKDAQKAKEKGQEAKFKRKRKLIDIDLYLSRAAQNAFLDMASTNYSLTTIELFANHISKRSQERQRRQQQQAQQHRIIGICHSMLYKRIGHE